VKTKNLIALILLIASTFPAAICLASPYGIQQSPAPVQVDQKTLQSYVGRYAFKGDVFFDVTLEDGLLHVKIPGQEKATLQATSQTDFRVKEAGGISLSFDKDNKGEVVGITVHQGADHKAKKIASVVPVSGASKFDPNNLDAYTGQYEVQPGFVLTVTNENGKLMGQPTGDEKIAFKHESGTEFTSDADGPKLKFVINDDGQVTGVKIELEGQVHPAKKIK
jgi:Domain of unknown function (DUF3471)